MKSYLELLRKVMDEGVDKDDRTGTGTRSLFGERLQIDLTQGFPLLTTKYVSFKNILTELIWMLRGDTNIKFLHDHGCHIWDEWRAPWKKDRNLVLVDVRTYAPVDWQGSYSTSGLNRVAGSVDDKLANIWRKMMGRCYDPSAHNYEYYGAQGITVSKEWQDPSTFVREVKEIPHWWYKQNDWNNFELDKDYYGSNQYNKESCVWLPKEENVNAQPICVQFPDGTHKWFLGVTDVAQGTGFSRSSIHAIS